MTGRLQPLDMGGFPIKNAKPGVDPFDVATVSQLGGNGGGGSTIPGVLGQVLYSKGDGTALAASNIRVNGDGTILTSPIYTGGSASASSQAKLNLGFSDALKGLNISIPSSGSDINQYYLFSGAKGTSGSGFAEGSDMMTVYIPASPTNEVVLEAYAATAMRLSTEVYNGSIYLAPGRKSRLRVNITSVDVMRDTVAASPIPLRMEVGQGGKYVGFKAPASQIATENLFTLPTTLGTANQVLGVADAVGTLALRTVRELPTGGNPFEVATKNIDGTDSTIWRLPDARSVAVVSGDFIQYTLSQDRTTFATPGAHLIIEISGKLGVGTNQGVTLGIDGIAVYTTDYGNSGINNPVERGWMARMIVTRTSPSNGLVEIDFAMNDTISKVISPVALTSQSWTSGNMMIVAQGRSNPDKISIVRSYFWNAGAASLISTSNTKTAVITGQVASPP